MLCSLAESSPLKVYHCLKVLKSCKRTKKKVGNPSGEHFPFDSLLASADDHRRC